MEFFSYCRQIETVLIHNSQLGAGFSLPFGAAGEDPPAVSYTHLRAHETPEHIVCRLLLEKKH